VILIVLLVIGFVFYGVISFFGLLIGGLVALQSSRIKRKHARKLQEPPSHVNLLTPPTPYNWETDLSGWDGAEELEIEEEL
jgi:hypothetical protein